MNFIKQYFIKNNISKNLKKNHSLESFSTRNLSKLALLVDFSKIEKIDSFLKFQKDFQISPENFIVLGYKPQTDETSVAGLPVFSDKDISLMGAIHNYHADRLYELDFDILFNFFDHETLPLVLLSSGIKARLRVGLPYVAYKFNDLIIHTTLNNQELFVREVKKIIATIK